MTKSSFLLIFDLLLLFLLNSISHAIAKSMVPVLTLDAEKKSEKIVVGSKMANGTSESLQYLPFIMLVDKSKDTSEYWRETEILSLVRSNEMGIDYETCEQQGSPASLVRFPSRRTVRPICRNRIELSSRPSEPKPLCLCHNYRPLIFIVKNRTYSHIRRCLKRRRPHFATTKKRKNKKFTIKEDIGVNWTEVVANNYQICPQCPHFSNYTECELFRDSCKERKVLPSEHRTYCDRKYGKWRAMLIPKDYSQCRCCDECVFYRELDQSCMEDEYNFDTEEFLPVTTIDFRAGCNPYWGHPEQEFRALRCDKILRRCVPVSVPGLPNETLHLRRSFRYEPPSGGSDCPVSCRGYECRGGLVDESQCEQGAFLPDKDQCNCCGRCSAYQQLNQKCAEFKKTIHNINGTKEIEVEEEFLEPGCDDGLVCRQGRCQDIHTVQTTAGSRRKRDDGAINANEPCKRELKFFKKKYGRDGHLHYNAPQCTPLWLYAPVQCRRFVCYCSLEDGSFIQGIKVPRVEVSNMNCDCAREKCRTKSDVECDGYGNYKEALFTPHADEWAEEAADSDNDNGLTSSSPHRTPFEEIPVPTPPLALVD